MSIKEIKKSLRKEMLSQRIKMNPAEKEQSDQHIRSELEKIIRESDARIIHAYIPIANEVDITPLLQLLLEEGRTVVCPKTLPARKLENRVLRSLDDLETGIMGTKHPAEENIYAGPFDIIIVPGLAFDKNLYRLGYGGGYYDNFLAANPESLRVGVFYAFQEMEKVPLEAHDVALHRIITG